MLYGTYDTCDTCEMCSVDEPPEFVDTTMAAKAKESGSTRDGKIHCKKCFGCNVCLIAVGIESKFAREESEDVSWRFRSSRRERVHERTRKRDYKVLCDFGGYKQHPETAAQHPLRCNEETQSKIPSVQLKAAFMRTVSVTTGSSTRSIS